MPNVIHDFHAYLERNTVDEDLFVAMHQAEGLEKAVGTYTYDACYRADGTTVEIKTDSIKYQMSPNIFYEKYSVVRDKKIGGPERALRDGVDFFVNWRRPREDMPYYVVNKLVFDRQGMEKLIDYVAKNFADARLIEVPNKGYVTGGYKIPVVDIVDFLRGFWWDEERQAWTPMSRDEVVSLYAPDEQQKTDFLKIKPAKSLRSPKIS